MNTMQVTVSTLRKMKAGGEKIAVLTAYDASFAHVLDDAGVDVILVGDSLGMVIQGRESTVGVSVDEMVYHTRAVSQGRHRSLLVADMPFMSYAILDDGLRNAARLMQEGGAHMVKLEGTANQVDIVARLAANGIPVCAHLGLRPQFVHKIGGYRVQGRDDIGARALLSDAVALESAGADLLVLECVPQTLAADITARVTIPVIGIGAGPRCDGQVLVLHDLIGVTPGQRPRFSKDFLADGGSVYQAVVEYVQSVKDGSFPGPEYVFD